MLDVYDRQETETLKAKKILVVQGKQFGDALLTTPLIDALLRVNKKAQITVVCRPSCSPIFDELDPRVSWLSLPVKWFEWINLMRYIRLVEVAFMPHEASAIALLVSLLGKPIVARRGAFKGSRFLKIRGVPTDSSRRHIVDQYLDLVRNRSGHLLDGALTPSVRSLISKKSRLKFKLPNRFLVCHPGSQWMFKSPDFEFWAAIISWAQDNEISIVLTGLNSGVEGRLLTELARLPGVIPAFGSTSIVDLSHIIRKCCAYVGVDTFATHIASSLGKPGVVLFGPSNPVLWGPYQDSKIEVLKHPSRSCLPCGFDGCGGSKISDCLNELSPNGVFKILKKYINPIASDVA